MNTKSKKVEIMAPVGDMIALDAALRAGADSVYFGVEGLNMRVGAKNFSLQSMKELCKKCAKQGVRKYLTLNTIYFEADQKEVLKTLKKAKSAGVDAVSAWDFSVLELAKKIGIEVYLSTQASVSNAEAIVSYHKKFGINRFVLARECGIDEIKKIRTKLVKMLGKTEAEQITFEVFAHGAMCVSVSGRCFMSLYQYGKSANRGECLQPCRRSYFIHDGRKDTEGFEMEAQHILSPKDLCTIPFLEKLLDAGVNSLKIEGRNRNGEYVFETVSAYKKLVEFYAQNRKSKTFSADFDAMKKEQYARLENVFHRGYSAGFYMGKPIGDWTSAGNEAKQKKVILGHVTNYFSKIEVAQISIDAESLSQGDEIQIEGDTTGFLRFKAEDVRGFAEGAKSAKRGDVISIKTPSKVRKSDRVYIFKKA